MLDCCRIFRLKQFEEQRMKEFQEALNRKEVPVIIHIMSMSITVTIHSGAIQAGREGETGL